ncbi:MAG: tRNA lysidine(34) synthetase TilS [Sphaerochaetaceae bacterium]|nr:tRNA lysidine(34) synthetase TilS [Sphaerochaetaceae bacterium]
MNSIGKSIRTELTAFFETYAIDFQDGILVAFSGGSDSLGLLYALSFILPPGKLRAAYVNHRLRAEDELARERERNRLNCEALGIPLSLLDLGVGQVARESGLRGAGTEDAARVLRYQALEDERRRLGFGYIATAHTSDDQLETLLMRLLQGGTLSSMKGIVPKNGCIIRPALRLTREDLRTDLRMSGLSWVEDSTNAADTYLRNRIRHSIIPAVLSVFPSAKESVCSFAERAIPAMEYLELASASVEPYIHQDSGRVVADYRAIQRLPEYLRIVAVYRMWNLLQKGMFAPLRYEMASRVAAMFSNDNTDEKNSMICSCGTVVEKVADHIIWIRSENFSTCFYVFPIDLSADDCVVPLCNGFVLERTMKNIDSWLAEAPFDIYIPEDRLVPPLVVRTWRDGDSIQLSDGTKLVSRLIGQWKVSASATNEIPVLEDRDGLVAVMGKAWGGRDRLAKRFKASPLARIGLSHYSVVKRNECSEQ